MLSSVDVRTSVMTERLQCRARRLYIDRVRLGGCGADMGCKVRVRKVGSAITHRHTARNKPTAAGRRNGVSLIWQPRNVSTVATAVYEG